MLVPLAVRRASGFRGGSRVLHLGLGAGTVCDDGGRGPGVRLVADTGRWRPP